MISRLFPLRIIGVATFAASTASLVNFRTITSMPVDVFSFAESYFVSTPKEIPDCSFVCQKDFSFPIITFKHNESNTGIWLDDSSISPSTSI